MSYNVSIEAEARQELEDAAKWYEQRSKGLGVKFVDAFLSVVEYLETHPLVYSKIEGDYRQVNMKVFPFIIVYKVVEAEVRVIAVFHASRDPAKKLR
jgi:plasmid stabilization system protein ParE